jgi:hypothetical protein
MYLEEGSTHIDQVLALYEDDLGRAPAFNQHPRAFVKRSERFEKSDIFRNGSDLEKWRGIRNGGQ